MTTPTDLRSLAAEWLEAIAAYDELVSIDYRERPDTGPAVAAYGAAYQRFASARGFRTGDRVRILPGGLPKNEGGMADVVRVNAETVTVHRLFDGKTYRIDPTKLRPGYHELELEARELVEDDLAAPVVVIPCGGAKTPYPAPAEELYVGSYFRAMLAAARTLTTDDLIFVLSGMHGFLSLSTVVEPYEQRIDEPGAVTEEVLRRDVVLAPALAEVSRGDRRAVVLAGSAYAGRAVEAFGPDARVELPFAGARSMGEQLGRAKAIRESADEALTPEELRDGEDAGVDLNPEPCSHLGKPIVHRGTGYLNDGPGLLCPECGDDVSIEDFRRAAATELLEAAKTVGEAGSSTRWARALELYLEVVGYRPEDRVYVSSRFERGETELDPRFGKVATIKGRDEEGRYLVHFDEADEGSAPAICPDGWLRPIMADLLSSAADALEDLEHAGSELEEVGS